MNPIALKATGLRRFTELSLDLQEGCVSIAGQISDAPEGASSNGAGKSTLPLAVELALFGPPPGFRSLADFVTAGSVDGRVEVELVFEHAGETYRVRRSYSAKGRGKPSLDFERYLGRWDLDAQNGAATYVPLTRESIKDTQAEIERITGLTQALYRASTYLAPGAEGSICDATPAECKRLFTEAVLGRDPVWGKLLKLVQRDAKDRQAQLVALQARVAHAEEELAPKGAFVQALSEAVAQENASDFLFVQAAVQLEAHTEAWQEAQRRASERRAAEAEHQQAGRERQRLREQAEQAEAARESIRVSRDRLAELADADALAVAEQAYSEARAEYDRDLYERRAISAEIEDLELNQVCPACGRAYDDREAWHRQIAAARRALAERGDMAAAPSDFEVRRIREQVTERARLEERTAAWQKAVAQVDSYDFRTATLEAEAHCVATQYALGGLPPLDQAELDRIQQQGLEARASVNAARQRLDDARAQKARLEAQLERLEAVELQAAQQREQADRLHAELDQLGLLERAYGDKGIPALLVENVAIPAIETEANRLLADLGTRFRVELHTQRAQKTTDTLAETLDIVIVDEQGNPRGYKTFSAGERARLSFAIGAAFALYLHTRGTDGGLLVVDDPEGLDAPGMASLVSAMRQLESVFPRVWLISQEPMLRDAFDQTITVTRDGAVSRVDAPVAAEAVFV